MVACNVFKSANILLTILIFVLIINVEFSTAANSKKSGKVSQNSSRPMTMLPKNQTIKAVSSFRFNVLVVGGFINMSFSLLNLIFALVNFYLIFGRYKSHLLQAAGKLSIAVEEMTNRDLHPKIKMSLARNVQPNTPQVTDMLALMKEPSPLFDDANGLLEGQKEARLRKTVVKEQDTKEEKGGKKSLEAKSGQSAEDVKSGAKSQPSDTKKNK